MDQEKIGKFISERRKMKKITQREFAEKLGVTDKTVSRWENGHYLPDVSLFNVVCEILDIEVAELLKGERIKKVVKKDIDETIDKIVDISNGEIKKKNKKVIMISGCIMFLFLIISCIIIFSDNKENEFILKSGDLTRFPGKYAYIEKDDGWVCNFELDYKKNSNTPYYYNYACNNYKYNYLEGFMSYNTESDEYGEYRYSSMSKRPPSYYYNDDYYDEIFKINEFFAENEFNKEITINELSSLNIDLISKDELVFLFNKAVSSDLIDKYGNYPYMVGDYMSISKDRNGYVWQIGISFLKGKIVYVNLELLIDGKNLSDIKEKDTNEIVLYNNIDKIEKHILKTQTLSLPDGLSYNKICNYLNELFDEIHLKKKNFE
ncbi:MAG: helix-turn-helix transcriptional regulator [Bacilli bacterium]|nr:helix-turn-helix transcriptional regulator [Bacilli bacterium]